MALRVIDYPRRGKAGWRHWLPSWRLVASTLIAFVLLVTGGAWAVYASISVPPMNESVTQQHLTVLDDQGVVLGRRGPEIRQDVPLSQVPVPVQNAFLSAEDRNFWSDGAISVTGTARALINDLGGGSTQGGSTITQQYVKNAYLSDERTLSRKVKEAVIALKISQQQSKSQILQGYLNTVYFGRGASGVEMGARAWFDKDVGQLTVAEGAVLAALVNAPSYYELAPKDPQVMAKLQGRWNYVLDGLVKMGKLSPADRAAQKFPAMAAWPRAGSQSDNQDPYLVEAAISEAEQKTGLTREQLVTGGYTIHTTFDAKMQDAAAAAVQAQITSRLDPKKRPTDANVHASIATVVPGDGAVRVLYGGDDYSKQAFNASWQGTLSPGSSFKTFALAAYLQNGGTVNDTFDGDSPYHVPDSTTGEVIPNEGGTSYGPVTVQYGLNQSINTVFVEMGEQIGMAKVADAARAAGVQVPVKDETAASLPLGVVSTNPEQMAGAYGTFAAHGRQADPYTVSSVEQDGKTVYQHQSAAKQAFTPLIADEVTQALQGVVTNGSGGGAQLADGREVAGKTGTTDLPGDGTQLGSVWFVGYTPTLSTAVTVWGQTEGGALTTINGMAGKDTVGGGAVAAPLWAAYMNKAVAGTPAQPFSFTAQNNQAVPMNPVGPSGTTSSTDGATPGQSPTGLPSPPAPTSTYQPPYTPPSTTPSTTGGGPTSSTTGKPPSSTSTAPSTTPSTSQSGPSIPSGSATTSGGVIGGPLLPQKSSSG